MATICEPGKHSWPELVGADGKIAVATIERENPSVQAIVVQEGESVIENFSCHRVWVWVSRSYGEVIKTPEIG